MTLSPETTFELLWNELGGPELTKEHRFHPTRRFRFDWAHLPSQTAIEYEGGIWTGGSHVRPRRYTSDCLKYNLAILMGWTVFRLTTDMLTPTHIKPIVEHIKLKRKAKA